MSDIEDGKYLIQVAVGHRPAASVDSGPGQVKPVITEGDNNVWTVKKLEDGKFDLTLEEEETGRPLFIHFDDEKLLASYRPPTPVFWTIQGRLGGPYTIEVPSSILLTRGWTVNNLEPKSPVTINFIEIPRGNQLWDFVRLPDPE